MTISFFILLANVLVSVSALRNKVLFYKLDFQPYMIVYRKEWWRFISHAFVHADAPHLLVNMYVLYTFGKLVEHDYALLFDARAPYYFALLFLGGILFSTIPGYARHRENYNYHGVGASGAVSAVVFAYILMQPDQPMGLLFIPGLELPAIVFGGAYLLLEVYLDRNRSSRIAHSAHYFGGIFGIVFTAAMEPMLITRWFG
jgi:membrane associated rhomboid family serine protease